MAQGVDGQGRLAFTAGIAGLLFAWFGFRIFDARDQLWHYGVDRTAVGAAAAWLAVITAVAYVVLAVLTARRIGPVRLVALALLVPAAVSVVYAIVLGFSHNSKSGFSGASLALTALVCAASAVMTAVRLSAADRR